MKECCEKYLNGQFGGDADIVGEIYGEYVSSVDAKLAECDGALADGDWTRLDRAAHTIKGNALAAGDTVMADTAIALRNAAKLNERSEAASLIAKLKEFRAAL